MLSGLLAKVFSIQENMTKKCHNHRLQTDLRHHEEGKQHTDSGKPHDNLDKATSANDHKMFKWKQKELHA